MKPIQLEHSVIAITGAAGELGRALARALAERGASLALMDRDAAPVQALAEELGATTRTHAGTADVCDMAQVQEAINAAAAHFGRLDVVIANAGVATLEPLAAQSETSFTGVIDVNLNGVFRTFKAGLPHVQATRGHLLAIASMASFFHSPMQGAYAASKAGVWALCDSVRVELRQQGVSVGSLHPSYFKTPLADRLTDNIAGRTLYDNNRGLFAMTRLDQVVTATCKAIEKRSQQVIVPGRNRPIAAMPNLLRRLTDRVMFGDRKMAQAMAQFDSASRGGL